MIDPNTVIFAIQSGIKLGKKINEALIAKTHERSLTLPLLDLLGNVERNETLNYFFQSNRHLVSEGGAYEGFSDDALVEEYVTIRRLNQHLGNGEAVSDEAVEIMEGLHRFEQTRNQTRPAVQQILGTVVEIGIDYFAVSPTLLEGDSNAKRILKAFIVNLDEVNFADSTPHELFQDVLLASLRTLDQNVTLIDDDERVQTLVGGITGSLIEDYEQLTSASAKDRRGRLIKRIASSVIRGGARAFSEDIDLFIEGDSTPKALVQSTLSQVVAGIDGRENLFTNESLELIFASALTAASENVRLFIQDALLQDLIKNTVTALNQAPVRKVFTRETVGAILQGGLGSGPG